MGLFSRSKKEIESPGNLQEVTQEIYKRNLDLAIVNKTLSLLRKLYQISLLTLDPSSLSEKISETVRTELNLEVVGIFSFNEEKDTLEPFSFSKSARLMESMARMGILFRDIQISPVKSKPILKETVYAGVSTLTTDIKDIWGGDLPDEKLQLITQQSHIKTVVLHPLIIQRKVIGVFLLGLNRDYTSMNDHEKDSIKSCVDVIAVALDKAYLYKELQDANEKLKSLDKLKTEFLSLASHQLRSPLTAIRGYASMLIEGSFGEIGQKPKEAVDRINESSRNLAMIVEDLLNVTKIESGGMKYEMTPFNLGEIVADTCKDMAVIASKKGIILTYTEEKGVDHVVVGDKEKIRQIILNFVDNAVKYTKDGTINVEVKKVGPRIVFSVQDSGMGIKPDVLPTLFNKFVRGEGSKMNGSGSGLGLYLAREIAQAHHGRTWAESAGPNLGSTFYLELDALNK